MACLLHFKLLFVLQRKNKSTCFSILSCITKIYSFAILIYFLMNMYSTLSSSSTLTHFVQNNKSSLNRLSRFLQQVSESVSANSFPSRSSVRNLSSSSTSFVSHPTAKAIDSSNTRRRETASTSTNNRLFSKSTAENSCSSSRIAKRMSPSSSSSVKHYDFFVIGGGSGGISAARRAASYGCKVGLAEGGRLGGTCVNVGCVPKKVMWNAAHLHEIITQSKHYGFNIANNDTTTVNLAWESLKVNRDKYVERLNGIYENNLKSSDVDYYPFYASFVENKEEENNSDGNVYFNRLKLFKVKEGKGGEAGRGEITNEEVYVTAEHVLIATGGKASKLNIPGEEGHTIDSDGFFALTEQPRKVAVIGAGYIAVELAGVFRALETETHLFVRFNRTLRNFDEMIVENNHQNMLKLGIKIHENSFPSKIETDEKNKKSIILSSGEKFDGFDVILVARGRESNVSLLNLKALKLEVKNAMNHLAVDEFQNTSAKNVYAVGDVCGQVELTPMAIAAGRRLADRLFGGMKDAKADYNFVPTVVFAHPPIATVGYTEQAATQIFGAENLRIYRNTSVNLFYGPFAVPPSEKPKTVMKMITLLPDEKIIGLHVVGMGSDEMMQGFAVAVKMGATKQDFDNCVAIHPTAAEEFVTMAPWGLPPVTPPN